MGADDYEGLDRGEKWGCGVAALVGFPTFFILYSLAALGHCEPECTWGKDPLLNVVLPSAAVTVLAFLLVRWAVNRRK